VYEQIEYRGFSIIYPTVRIVGTIHPYQINVKSDDPRLSDTLKQKNGKHVLIIDNQDVQDGMAEAKQIIDEMLGNP
jgi:hypothetical protein